MSNLRLAITGNLQKTLDARKLAYLQGLKAGVQASTDQGKDEIRADIIRAGFPRRLATTVRGDVFPSGNRLSYSPSGIIYSKSPRIIAGFADGGIRRPQDDGALIIPIEGGPADNIQRRPGETTVEAFERKFGRGILRLINRRGKSSLLVARFKTGGVNIAGASSGSARQRRNRSSVSGRGDVPVFTVLRQFRAEKRLDTRRLLARAARRHPARLAFHLREHLQRSEQQTAIR